MRFNTQMAWPHPVLSPLTGDIAPPDFDFNLGVVALQPHWIIGVETVCPDTTLSTLASNRKAVYFLRLECKGTYYREGFQSHDPKFEIHAPIDSLHGTVEASFGIVAVEEIQSYRHPGQHPDYGNSTFSLRAGEPLAVAISKTFEAFRDADPILDLPSIIDIKRSENPTRFMLVKLGAERITIILPSEDFDQYKTMRSNSMVGDLLASAILLPALIQAINYLKGLSTQDLEDFKTDHRWARHLLARLEKMGLNIFREGDNDVPLEAAQQLLHAPLRRSLLNIKTLFSD